MARLAMTREGEGGTVVPVAMSEREGDDSGELLAWKTRQGTEPHVRGPMKEAMALRPGCRYRSNLWTLFGVLSADEKMGLIFRRRGPTWRIKGSFDLRGVGWEEDRVILKLQAVCLCSWRRREKRARGFGAF
jgi:hypothetical protein